MKIQNLNRCVILTLKKSALSLKFDTANRLTNDLLQKAIRRVVKNCIMSKHKSVFIYSMVSVQMETLLLQVAVVQWLARLTSEREDPASNLIRVGCVYHDGHCDMQPWARAAHLLQYIGQLSLASLRGCQTKYQLRLGEGRKCHLKRVADKTV